MLSRGCVPIPRIHVPLSLSANQMRRSGDWTKGVQYLIRMRLTGSPESSRKIEKNKYVENAEGVTEISLDCYRTRLCLYSFI